MTTTSESSSPKSIHPFGCGGFRGIIGERQVNVRVEPTSKAIEESADLAHEIFNRVFRRVPERIRDDE